MLAPRCRPILILLTSLLLICINLSISGCWDRRELQERNFILAVGIDMADAVPSTTTESFLQPHGSKRYHLSYQILKVGPGPGKERKTFVLSNTGESFFEATRDMLGQTSKSLWFEHIQAVVISEAVVRQEGLDSILDFFLRDSEMRSRIHVYITPQTAQAVLEHQPPSGIPSGMSLGVTNKNHIRNNHIIFHADLGFIEQTLLNKEDVILPRLELLNGGLKVGGAAVFHQDQFAGYLDEYAVAGIKFIRATEKTALITANCPRCAQHILTFDSVQQSTKLTPHVDKDQIYFTLDIALVGNLSELHSSDNEACGFDPTNPDDVRELESLFAEQVKEEVIYAYQCEQQLYTDNLHFDVKLKKQYPAVWAKIKDNWRSIFPTIPLIPSVNVSIRSVGKHK